jgi:hypothetical protein
MPALGGGFEQSYNAQAVVDTDTMLVLANGLTQAANDKLQLVPMLQALGELPDDLGKVEQLLGDAGYFSAANVHACIDAVSEPLLAPRRESHHLPWKERFAEPTPLAEPATRWRRCAIGPRHRLNGSCMFLRKQIVEPVFASLRQ